jgi:hypothetical protein
MIKFTIDEKYPNQNILQDYPIVPYRKNKLYEDFWKKDFPKRCPGMMEYFNLSQYVVPLWESFELRIPPPDESPLQEVSVQNKPPSLVKCRIHSLGGWADVAPNFGNKWHTSLIKLHTPWLFSVPKGYSTKCYALDYNFGEKFYPFSGTLHDVGIELIVFMLVNKNAFDENGVIKFHAGEPLMIVEPYNTNDLLKHEIVTNGKERKEMIDKFDLWYDISNMNIIRGEQKLDEATILYNALKNENKI